MKLALALPSPKAYGKRALPYALKFFLLRAYPKISRTPLAPHIFRHTALIFLAGRQPAREKSPCLAKSLRHDWRTANFGISSYFFF